MNQPTAPQRDSLAFGLERDERRARAHRDVARIRDIVANRGPLSVASILAPHEQSLLALDDMVTAVRDLHAPFEWSFGQGPVRSCRECVRLGAPQEESAHPCPTVRALDGGAA